jgi:hypothetical protein
MATATIIDNLNNKTKSIFLTNYPLATITESQRLVQITEVLPFRVRFSAIQVEKIGLGNTPAIPLQVIGYSNYIL